MNKSFTLIEVLIATMIIFIAVGAVIGVSSDTKHLFSLLKEQKKFDLISSIALIEQKNVKNLYEQVTDFNISDDELIHTLKKHTVSLDTSIDTSTDINISDTKKATLYIKKIKAYNNEYSNQVYGIEIK